MPCRSLADQASDDGAAGMAIPLVSPSECSIATDDAVLPRGKPKRQSRRNLPVSALRQRASPAWAETRAVINQPLNQTSGARSCCSPSSSTIARGRGRLRLRGARPVAARGNEMRASGAWRSGPAQDLRLSSNASSNIVAHSRQVSRIALKRWVKSAPRRFVPFVDVPRRARGRGLRRQDDVDLLSRCPKPPSKTSR